MTEKRFDVIHSPVTGLFVVTDDEHKEVFEGIKSYGNACRFANLLNVLHEENEQLKQQLTHLEYRFTEYRNKTLKEIKEMCE